MKCCLYIFRRDLRTEDNNGFNFAIDNFDKIIPIFIFTPEQITNKNKYKSNNAIEFMIESLKVLNNKLNSKLLYFQGDNNIIINKILSNYKNIDAIVTNIDYTPYAINRDKNIKILCQKYKIEFNNIEDYLLLPIGSMLKSDGNPYTIFTPFYKNGIKNSIPKPIYKKNINNKLFNPNDLNNITDNLIKNDINLEKLVKGGRDEGLKILNNIKKFKKYGIERNELYISTTHLSAYIKFGCLSIREVFHRIKKILGISNILISQLYWREFYFYIAYYYPEVLNGKNYNKKYNNIKWIKNTKNLELWKEGKTGYPIIDAGMIELNRTGYMHNRARLITANFLNRLLGIDWREGELYYATKLTDYDPSINNGNWQWIASTGVDPKPYFQRLFNPWIQSKKFDKNAQYIKKWIPQLSHICSDHLHNWDKHCNKYDLKNINYYEPIVNYKKARERSINMYRDIL